MCTLNSTLECEAVLIDRSLARIHRKLFKSPADHKTLLRRMADKAKRIKLNAAWHIASQEGSQRQRTKRAIEEKVRNGKLYSGDTRTLSTSECLFLLRKFRPSKLLSGFYPDRDRLDAWIKVSNRDPDKVVELDLSNFSLSSNPHGVLDGLELVAAAEAKFLQAQINFKDQRCLDVVPFMLLVECWGDMLPIFEGGEMDIPMQKVLSAVGIEYALNVKFAGISEYNDVWAFPLTRRRLPGETRSRNVYADVPTRDVAADRFCDAIDEWLGRPEIELELNDRGRAWIKNLLGELLENAERHADGERRDGSWSVSGFLEKVHGEAVKYRANIGILSVGDTFSESLRRALPHQQEQIASYVRTMRELGAPQSEDTLRTLAALQDGVTCVREADEEDRGGFGLMEILDMVAMLGGSSQGERTTEVSIVSGSSCIVLRHPYERGTRYSEGTGSPRVQWFNNENSAKVPPDVRHVFDLKKTLPGTAISVNFVLDPSHLRRAFDDDREHDDQLS
jgi:hypothetical protein